jgi:hypothetical protein
MGSNLGAWQWHGVVQRFGERPFVEAGGQRRRRRNHNVGAMGCQRWCEVGARYQFGVDSWNDYIDLPTLAQRLQRRTKIGRSPSRHEAAPVRRY